MAAAHIDFSNMTSPAVTLINGEQLVILIENLIGSKMATENDCTEIDCTTAEIDCTEHKNIINRLETFRSVQSNIHQAALYSCYISMCFWLTVVISLIAWRKLRNQRSMLHLSTLTAW